MTEILDYSFLGWPQFLIILVISIMALLVANRFHLFDRHSWNTSIGYHMFFCVILSIVIIAFLLVRPIFHLIFLLVVFGFIYRNVFSYVRSVYNLYFSNIHMGDRIRIDGSEGILTSINIGGMHISANSEKTYFPFNNWKGDKIVLLSEAGKVPVTFLAVDQKERNNQKSIYELEKSIFEFPYLNHDPIGINDELEGVRGKVMISSRQYKESLIGSILNAGFKLTEKNI